jgi:hypothetical protein
LPLRLKGTNAMSVGIQSSNPAFTLASVQQAQLSLLTGPAQTPGANASPATAGGAPGLPTFNNLSSSTSDIPSAADLATSTTASTLTAGGTVSLGVLNGSAAQLTFTNSATGEKSVIGTASAGLTTNVNGSNVTSGNLSTNDVGVYAAAQNGPTPLPGTLNAAYTVQSGATQGSSTSQGVTNDQTAPVALSALSSANTDAGHLNSFISQYA